MARPTGAKDAQPRTRKPVKTWRQRKADDPHGASPVAFELPHELGAFVEEQALAHGLSVSGMLKHWAHEKQFATQVF